MPIADSARVIVTAIASVLLIALSSTAFADGAPAAALKRAPVPRGALTGAHAKRPGALDRDVPRNAGPGNCRILDVIGESSFHE